MFSAIRNATITNSRNTLDTRIQIQLTGRAANTIKKVLLSAVANAEHNDGADIDELKVSTIMIDEGSTFKRGRARAKGRGTRILKRNSHITVTVADDNTGQN